MEEKTVDYLNYTIKAKEFVYTDKETNKEKTSAYWEIYKSNKFIFSDYTTIDGSMKLTKLNQAINDAKKNVESLERMNNDKIEFEKRWSKLTPEQKYESSYSNVPESCRPNKELYIKNLIK